MINFVEEYMSPLDIGADEGFDEQRVLIKSISKVLPLIIENELTPRQGLCLRLFYVHQKSQTEIARQLHLSQPTVCRHIKTARDITNKCLGYCYYCVKYANEQWLNAE